MSWSSPPASKAPGRLGFANTRSLAADAADVAVPLAASRDLPAVAEDRAARAARCRPADAGAVGFGSAAGSLSSRWTAVWVTLRSRGTGYARASDLSCP